LFFPESCCSEYLLIHRLVCLYNIQPYVFHVEHFAAWISTPVCAPRGFK